MDPGVIVLGVFVVGFVLLVALAVRRMARKRAELEAETEPEAEPEAELEATPVSPPAPVAVAKPEVAPKLEAAPKPVIETKPEVAPKLEAAPKPVIETKPEVAPKLEAAPKPVIETKPEVAPKPVVLARPEVEPKPQIAPSKPPITAAPIPRPAVTPVEKPAAPKAAPSARDLRRQEERVALREGLKKTRSGFFSRLTSVFQSKQLPPDLIDRLEETMLTSDIGVKTTQKLLDKVRGSLSRQSLQDADAVFLFLRDEAARLLSVESKPFDPTAAKPFVLLVVGVNGTGKTTTIGKLAARLRDQGRSVLVAAGDTFRAAAAEQLEIWANRTGAKIVRGKEGADPSSVVFEAVKQAQKDGIEVVIADTAGRLHTKTNLMDELQKVRRVLGKAQEGAPHETLLVLDATTGQNAVTQASMFKQAIEVSGAVLTKLDGTAKGGVILAVSDEVGIPVRFVGVGERIADLREFDPEAFADALFLDARAPDAPASGG